MATQKITDLTASDSNTLANNDQFVVVDVSDTTMASSGTNKKIGTRELRQYLENNWASSTWALNGGFYQNTTSFIYFTSGSASASESSTVNYITICPIAVACRVVDVAVWVQSGSARDETINVYDHKQAGQAANLGGVTASVSAGNVTVFTYNTSDYDLEVGSEFTLGWSPNTAPLGVSFQVRFKSI